LNLIHFTIAANSTVGDLLRLSAAVAITITITVEDSRFAIVKVITSVLRVDPFPEVKSIFGYLMHLAWDSVVATDDPYSIIEATIEIDFSLVAIVKSDFDLITDRYWDIVAFDSFNSFIVNMSFNLVVTIIVDRNSCNHLVLYTTINSFHFVPSIQ